MSVTYTESKTSLTYFLIALRAALRQLGIHDCHHMQSVMGNLTTEAPAWTRAIEAKYEGKGTFTKADWDALLGTYQACCDVPSALFACELAEMYPDAKVVILDRDVEKWYVSVLNSIYKMMQPPSRLAMVHGSFVYAFDPLMRNWINFFNKMVHSALGYDHGKQKDRAIQWYKDIYKEYREKIPAHCRLEYKIQDGWGPLCKHLGMDVPTVTDPMTGKEIEAPFPRTNDAHDLEVRTKAFYERATQRANSNLFAAVGKLAILGFAGYGAYLAWKTKMGDL